MKRKITLVKIVLIIITIAIVFYNIGIAVTLKTLKPHAVNNGYEIEVFGQIYYYED